MENVNKPNSTSAPRVPTLQSREQEIEVLLQKQQELVSKLDNPELGDDERAALERVLETLADSVGAKLSSLEQVLDPMELAEREKIATLKHLDYVSKEKYAGVRIGSMPEQRGEFIVPKVGNPIGPYMAVHGELGDRYLLAYKEHANSDALCDVYDMETGVSREFKFREMAAIGNNQCLIRNTDGYVISTFDELMAGTFTQDAKAYVYRTGPFYILRDEVPWSECGLGKVYSETHGYLGTCHYFQYPPTTRDSNHLDIRIEKDGDWVRMWDDGRKSGAFVAIEDNPLASTAIVTVRDTTDSFHYSILSEQGEVHGGYLIKPICLPGNLYLIDGSDIREGERKSASPKGSYVVDESGKVLTGPWEYKPSGTCMTHLVATEGRYQGKDFVLWRNGHLYGPIVSSDEFKPLRSKGDRPFLTVVMESPEGNVGTYIICDAGKLGPFISVDSLANTVQYRIAKTEADTSSVVFENGSLFEGYEAFKSTSNSAAVLASKLILAKDKEPLEEWYLLSKDMPPVGPVDFIESDKRVMWERPPYGYQLESGTNLHFFLTCTNKLLGPFSSPPSIEDGVVHLEKDDVSRVVVRAFVDADGEERFRGV